MGEEEKPVCKRHYLSWLKEEASCQNGLGALIVDNQGFVSPVIGAAGQRAMGVKY